MVRNVREFLPTVTSSRIGTVSTNSDFTIGRAGSPSRPHLGIPRHSKLAAADRNRCHSLGTLRSSRLAVVLGEYCSTTIAPFAPSRAPTIALFGNDRERTEADLEAGHRLLGEQHYLVLTLISNDHEQFSGRLRPVGGLWIKCRAPRHSRRDGSADIRGIGLRLATLAIPEIPANDTRRSPR